MQEQPRPEMSDVRQTFVKPQSSTSGRPECLHGPGLDPGPGHAGLSPEMECHSQAGPVMNLKLMNFDFDFDFDLVEKPVQSLDSVENCQSLDSVAQQRCHSETGLAHGHDANGLYALGLGPGPVLVRRVRKNSMDHRPRQS